MKKRFLMLLAALLLILLAIPALIGAWIRSADAQMLLAPLSAQTGAQFIKGETRGGWFHSHIEFDIHWPQLSQIVPDSDVYRLHLHIRHGPLFFSHRGLEAGLAYAEVVPEFSGALIAATDAVLQVEAESHMSLLADLRGDWRLDINLADVSFASGTSRTRIQGLESSTRLAVHNQPGGSSYGLRQTVSMAQIQSPGLPLEQLDWTLRLEGLDDELISLYAGLMAHARQSAASRMLPGGLGDRAALLLLQHPLQLSLEAQMTAWGGEHRADLAILWAGLSGLRSLQDFQLAAAVAALQMNLQLAADRNALQQSPVAASVAVYEQQGLLQTDGSTVHLDARLTDGNLMLNDQLLPLQPFLNLQ